MLSERKSNKGIEAELRGTTLRIYWHIFKSNNPVGVREVQRKFRLASPSTALYHLDKLKGLGVVQKDRFARYYLVEQVKVGTLRLFMKFGNLVLPRYLFYAVFFSASLIMYLVASFLYSSPPDFMALILGLSASTVSIYETIRIWRERLF